MANEDRNDPEVRINNMLGAIMVLREVIRELVRQHPTGDAVMTAALGHAQQISDLAVSSTLPEATLRGMREEMTLLRLVK